MYYRRYPPEVKRALNSGSDVRGYFAWSYLDYFEQTEKCSAGFGFVSLISTIG